LGDEEQDEVKAKRKENKTIDMMDFDQIESQITLGTAVRGPRIMDSAH
jgi:hypothetical protein